MTGVVIAVSRDATHRFSKPACDAIRMRAGLGIVLADGTVQPGDAIRVALPKPPHQALLPV